MQIQRKNDRQAKKEANSHAGGSIISGCGRGKKDKEKKRANHQLFLAPGVTHMCAQSLHYLENGSLRAASTLMGPPLHKQHTHVSKGLRCCQLASTLLPPVL